MSKELIPVLLWIKVNPVRILVFLIVFSNVFPFTFVPVFLCLLSWTVVGISLGNSTAWLVLESLHIDGLDQLTLLSEWDLWCLIEHIVYAHVIVVE